MNRLSYTLLLTLIAASSLVYCQPKFQLNGKERFDIGDVPNFLPHKHSLTITNPGTDTLILRDLSASCGCTATLLSADHIAPGDSGILSFIFDAKRFDGKVEKKISINTNDDSRKHVEIFFTANVVRILDIQPEYFFFRTPVDSPATQTLRVQNLSTDDISFSSISPTGKEMAVKLIPDVIKPGETSLLTAIFTPASAGTTNGNIEIVTTHPGAPHLTLRYFCWVKEKK